MKISALVVVERPQQKGIVIGKGGEMLKRIGTLARKEMQKPRLPRAPRDVRKGRAKPDQDREGPAQGGLRAVERLSVLRRACG